MEKPDESVSIYNGVISLDKENGIVKFIKHPQIKESDYKGTLELYDGLCEVNKDKLPIMLNFEGLEKMSMDCRMFLMNRIFDLSNRVAIVVEKGSPLLHQFNTANHLFNKPLNITFHYSAEDALNWLNTSN